MRADSCVAGVASELEASVRTWGGGGGGGGGGGPGDRWELRRKGQGQAWHKGRGACGRPGPFAGILSVGKGWREGKLVEAWEMGGVLGKPIRPDGIDIRGVRSGIEPPDLVGGKE